MDKKFRIVFQGTVRDDFDPAAVRQQAALRLKANPAQIERIFSGARAVLKQGLDAAQGQAYQHALQQLGMIVAVEEIPPAVSPQPPTRIETVHPPEVCKFERTHINLARAEALLNGTDPTQIAPAIASALPAATLPSPKVPETSTPNDAWMHESGFVSLERAQKKLADATAQLTLAAETPAQSARQSLPDTEPSTLSSMPARSTPTRPAQVFSSIFQCSHCGSKHQIENRMELHITAMPAGERAAS